MANYYGSARSNYFKVKDETAFQEALFNIPDIEVHGNMEEGFCILVAGGDCGGWPSNGWDDEKEEEFEFDIVDIVSEHLIDDEVAIFMESGAEKMRYVVGYAEAVNNKGERESISLNDIYEKAATSLTNKSASEITKAEY